jgi:hypothetical protein
MSQCFPVKSLFSLVIFIKSHFIFPVYTVDPLCSGYILHRKSKYYTIILLVCHCYILLFSLIIGSVCTYMYIYIGIMVMYVS